MPSAAADINTSANCDGLLEFDARLGEDIARRGFTLLILVVLAFSFIEIPPQRCISCSCSTSVAGFVSFSDDGTMPFSDLGNAGANLLFSRANVAVLVALSPENDVN